MLVKKAECAGACYGVKRALELAYDAAEESGTVQTLGPLIHNPQVVSELQAKGVSVAETVDGITADTLIIRSHGVTPQVRALVDKRAARVIDATCPYVVRAQRAAADLAANCATVVVVGEESHPEVEGLCAFARQGAARIIVAVDASQIPAEVEGPVGVVVQTTQDRRKLDAVIEALKDRGFDPIVKDTICSATSERQHAAADLAAKTDAMVVVGGRNSSNTTRLFEICKETNPRTYHVETIDELDKSAFAHCAIVGVTAGASTPDERIKSVISTLSSWYSARVKSVLAKSPADDAGFTEDCFITAVDGHPIHDIIDWRWYASDDSMTLIYTDADGDSGEVELEREAGQDWGFEFDGAIFDGIRQCRNACIFCFMRQLPADARASLTLRDDDFRLSFLQGTFVTFTNIDAADEARIIEQHISPLRFSLHATSPDLRKRMIGANAAHGMEVAQRLLDAGITMHAQIVLMPGVNDEEELTKTLEWAYAREGVESIGIVPLGYTKYQRAFDKSFNDEQSARRVVECVRPFQERAMLERGIAWVYPSDEFYSNAYPKNLLANLPPTEYYGDFDLFEDGIGIIRSFVDDWQASTDVIEHTAKVLRDADARVLLVCGCAQKEFIEPLVNASPLRERVVPLFVKNEYFGGNVNVTGLLCACDVADALHAQRNKGFQCAFVLSVMFNADDVTLDGLKVEDIEKTAGVPVHVVSCQSSGYLPQIAETVERFSQIKKDIT